MDILDRIHNVQKLLKEHHIDGWLIYDFHKSNELLYDFLCVPKHAHLTRRFFYWIPAGGEPKQLIHVLDSHVMDHLPGEKLVYMNWHSLRSNLEKIFDGVKTVAMEYSPLGMNPYISKVDAGTVELVRELGVEVISSGPFLQYFTCLLSPFQYQTHVEAAKFLEKLIQEALLQIKMALEEGRHIDEYCLQQWILREMEKNQFMTEGEPIVAVNSNSGNPHYCPTKDHCSPIRKGDFILLDMWCKKKVGGAVFADLTFVAVASQKPSPLQEEIFSIVRESQEAATEFVKMRFANNQIVKGFEVDEVCRRVIQEKGYGEQFIHRTGHNLYIHNHGPGASLDSLEILDERPVLQKTCFTIEPGIYLKEFGIRLEYDVYISEKGEIEITSQPQEKIQCLF